MDRDAEKADRQDQTPPGDAPTAFEREPGLAAEPVVDQRDLGSEREPGLAAEPVVDQGSYGQDPGDVGDEPVEDAGPGGQDGVYDQEADRAGRQPPPNS
jgi:hypothetical protein